jgi:hypothetical protein
MRPAGASEADYSNRWGIVKPSHSQDHGIHFRLSSLHCSETRYVDEYYTNVFLPCYPHCIILETMLNTMHLLCMIVHCDAYVLQTLPLWVLL